MSQYKLPLLVSSGTMSLHVLTCTTKQQQQKLLHEICHEGFSSEVMVVCVYYLVPEGFKICL